MRVRQHDKACCLQIILSLCLRRRPCFVYNVYEQRDCGFMVGTLFLRKNVVATPKKKKNSVRLPEFRFTAQCEERNSCSFRKYGCSAKKKGYETRLEHRSYASSSTASFTLNISGVVVRHTDQFAIEMANKRLHWNRTDFSPSCFDASVCPDLLELPVGDTPVLCVIAILELRLNFTTEFLQWEFLYKCNGN